MTRQPDVALPDSGAQFIGPGSALFLHIYPLEGEEEWLRISKILQIRTADAAIEGLRQDAEFAHVAVVFAGSAQRLTLADAETWVRQDFRVAADWLSGVTPKQVKDVKRLELEIALAIYRYSGAIPSGLIRQLDRLGIELVVIQPGTGLY